MITLVLALLIIVLATAYFFYIQDYDIPGPMRIPLIGNIQLCLSTPSEFITMTRYFKEKYGDAYLIYVLNDPHVVMSHPKYVTPLLTGWEYITKGTAYNVAKDWLGKGLLVDGGSRWKAFRKLLTPAFHFTILQTILQVFLKNQNVFIENLKKHAKDGQPFDLFPIVGYLALDNVTESIMGVSVNAQTESDSEYVRSVTELTKICASRFQNPIVSHDTLFKFLPQKKIYDKCIKVAHEATRKVIRLRRQTLKNQNITSLANKTDFGKDKNAFLDLLLLSEIDGSKIDEESIREQVDTFMFEGHDTTTSAVVFALYSISQHQDVQKKILDEQIEILNGDLVRDPTFAEINQMKYLEMVIKESLRLYPSVPIIERMICKDVEINGLKLKKGWSAMVNIIELQRHPDLYEKPNEFIPERFDPANQQESKNTFGWIAFSAGPRNCIGQKFAMMEVKVIVASVVKNFKLLPVDDPLKLCSELVLRSSNGVKIRLQQR